MNALPRYIKTGREVVPLIDSVLNVDKSCSSVEILLRNSDQILLMHKVKWHFTNS